MKKIVSLAVAMLLVVGLFPTVTALAADYSGHLKSPVIGFSDTVMLNDDKVHDFDKIILGKDNMNLIIPVYEENFKSSTGTLTGPDVNQLVMDNCPLEFKYNHAPSNGTWVRIPDPKIFVADYNRAPHSGGEIARYTLTAQKVGAVDMQVRMVFLDPSDIHAAPLEVSDPIDVVGEYLDPTINKEIINIVPLPLDREGVWINDKKVTDTSILQNMVLEPGTEIRFDVNTEFFTWSPDILDMAFGVRRASLDNDKITIDKKVIKGNQLIESIAFENIDGYANIVIRFVSDFANIKDKEFDFNIYLAQRHHRQIGTETRIMGTFGNPIYEADADNDYIYLGDGTVVDALRACSNVELDLGEGVVATTNLLKGQKYYGKATTELDDDAREIMNYFVSIRKTIRLNAVNIKNRTRFVQFRDMEQDYYVYDADGAYLGRTATDKMEYRDRYYLSTKEIDFSSGLEKKTSRPDEISDEPEEEEEEFSENPTTGGGSIVPMGILSVAGLAALSAGLYALSRKKEDE